MDGTPKEPNDKTAEDIKKWFTTKLSGGVFGWTAPTWFGSFYPKQKNCMGKEIASGLHWELKSRMAKTRQTCAHLKNKFIYDFSRRR